MWSDEHHMHVSRGHDALVKYRAKKDTEADILRKLGGDMVIAGDEAIFLKQWTERWSETRAAFIRAAFGSMM